MRKPFLALLLTVLSLGSVRAQDDRQEDAFTAESRYSITAIIRPMFSDRIFPSETARLNNASSMVAFGWDFGVQAALRISYRSRLVAGFFGINRLYSITSEDRTDNGQAFNIIRKYHWSYNQIQTVYHHIFVGTTNTNVFLSVGIGHNILQRLEVTNTEVPSVLLFKYPPNAESHDGLRNAGFNMYVPSILIGFGTERVIGRHLIIGGEPNFQMILGRVGPGQYEHSLFSLGVNLRIGYQFGLGGD